MGLLPTILQDCKIFPCVPGGKVPAIEDGWKAASSDPAQIAEWQRQFPGCNWAVATGLSGLFVFDADPEGLIAWEQLKSANPALASTFTVKTPRGGFHAYFKGEGPSTASRIADGIDTRGGFLRDGKLVSGGYVLLPGSRTSDGTYTELGGELTPLGDLARLIPERKKSETSGLTKDPDKDQPRNVAWAVDLLTGYVASGRVSLQGKGGNDTAFRVAASILDKAISPGTCYDLMAEHWNDHCQPPWEDWELETIIRNAANYGEDTKGGVKGFQANEDAFAAFAGQSFEDTKPEKRKRFQPMWLKEARLDKRPARWLIPNLLPAEGTGILYGLSGSYKTFVALDWALCLAFGIGGQWDAPPVKHQVLFLAGESSYALRQERVDAWCAKHNLNADDADFIFVHGVPTYSDTEGWTEIRDGLAAMGARPALIVIDTLTREMTGLDENSNNDGKMVLRFNEELAEHYGCMVLAIGHTGKDQSKGLRGAQVFIDNSDAVLFLQKMNGGVALKPKKLKEVDCDESPIFLAVKDYEKSIVLEKIDALPETPKAGKSRLDWASQEEVVKILAQNSEPLATGMLVQMIHDMCGVDHAKVRKAIYSNPDIQWLRHGDSWKLPYVETEQEFDL